jgi:LAO/AO transport system kinase
MWQQMLAMLQNGDVKSLARAISFVENEQYGYEDLLGALKTSPAPVIGITGAPGAGKSTLVDRLIGAIVSKGLKVAVLCVDPSSPFNLGSLLGDRIRMNEWYSHPSVFIRSLATRGSMGGLHPRIIEITDLVKAAGFDIVIVETVGVGQSEIEIAGLADCTVVVLVPEGGDEVQTMKAGLMEIADIFVINKSDRPGADNYVKNLRQMLAPAFHSHKREIPVIKTVANEGTGINELAEQIERALQYTDNEKKSWLLTERTWQLIQKKRMKDIDKSVLKARIEDFVKQNGTFNMYAFTKKFSS